MRSLNNETWLEPKKTLENAAHTRQSSARCVGQLFRKTLLNLTYICVTYAIFFLAVAQARKVVPL